MRTLTLVSLFSLLLTAGATAQPTKPDPCDLLSHSEIKAAIGAEIGPLESKAWVAGFRQCMFKVVNRGAGAFFLLPLSADDTPKSFRADAKQRGAKVSDARGLGAGAFYSTYGFGVTQLHAFQGSNVVVVQLMLEKASESQVKGALDKLMAAVLPKVR